MKVLRRCGQGDVSHVRDRLVQVAAFDPCWLEYVLPGVLQFATNSGLMLRLHVNMDQLSTAARTDLLNVFYCNQDHQLEPWSGLSTDQLAQKALQCEFIIQGPDTKPRLVESEWDPTWDTRKGPGALYRLLMEYWEEPRPLGGNFQRLSLIEIEQKRPGFVGMIEND